MQTVRLVIGLAGSIMVLSATPAAAENLMIPNAYMSVWVPDNWSMQRQGHIVTVSEPTDRVQLAFATFDPSQLGMILSRLDQELARYVSNLQVIRGPEQSVLNGLPIAYIDAMGTFQGTWASISFAVLRAPNNYGVLLIAATEAAYQAYYQPSINQVLGSLRSTVAIAAPLQPLVIHWSGTVYAPAAAPVAVQPPAPTYVIQQPPRPIIVQQTAPTYGVPQPAPMVVQPPTRPVSVGYYPPAQPIPPAVSIEPARPVTIQGTVTVH